MFLKNIFCSLLAFVLLMVVVPSLAKEVNSVVIHVSPSGADKNDGSQQAPLATLAGVVGYVKNLNKNVTDVTVLIHAGVYYMDKGITITENDWDGDKRTVTFKAAGDGEVKFSGTKTVDIAKFTAVTDKALLENFVPSAKPYIGQIDLSKQGFTREMVDFTVGWSVGTSAFPIGVFLNGGKEKLAGFPNSGFARIENVINPGGQRRYGTGAGNVGTFEVLQDNIKRWGNVKNAYIVGYLGVEYSSEWAKVGSVDTDKQTITMADWTQYGIKNKYKWSIANLPEEIDIPGEWYIDFESMIMYYYPRYPLSQGEDILEIAILKEPFFMLKNINNIHIEGLTFRNSEKDAVVCDNVGGSEIKDCKIYNIGGSGIYVSQANNLSISGCDIYYTANVGICIEKGGDRNTLTSSGNRIFNNHIYKTGTDTGSNWNGGIRIGANTVGNIIENNLIHGIKNYSYTFGGNENIFQFNEVWNGNRETADSGPIYSGRHLNEYGNAILYNYVHDCYNYENNNYGNHIVNSGDDWQSGTIIKNNILYMGKKTKTTCNGTHSRDNVMQYNIQICAGNGLALGDRYGYIPNILDSTNATTQGLLDTLNKGDGLKEGFSVTPVWQKKYPQISTILDDIIANNGRFMTRDNVITDNVSVDAPNAMDDPLMAKISTVERNLDIKDYSVFVNPNNHDFRLTREAMNKYNLNKNLMNEDNFSMDEIGIRPEAREIKKVDGAFRQVYPRNGQAGLQRGNLELVWEPALYADEYEYVVATDSEMKNVVASGKTLYNTVALNDLENEQSYYWKVRAKNLSKQIGNEWESAGAPSLFTISQFDNLNKDVLNERIDQAKKLADSIVEGNEIGSYKQGTANALEIEIQKAEQAAAIRSGKQDIINEAQTQLKKFTDGLGGYKISGFSGITANTSDWIIRSPNNNEYTTIQENETLGVSAERGKVILAYSQPVENYKVLKFKINSDLSPFFGLALRQTNPALMPFESTSNSYLIIVKENIFELQKYNPSADKTGILLTFPNNGIVRPGQWHNITFGAVDVPGGVEIILKVDNASVFDYYDSSEPNYKKGYFTILSSYNGGKTMVKPADSVPTEIYTPPESLFTKNSSIEAEYYTTKSQYYSETGGWGESVSDGYNNEKLRVSDGGAASAKWEMLVPMNNYKIYFWHTAVPDGDPNATVSFITSGGILGNFQFDKKVDFTQGESGWKEIGTFTAISPDGKNGVLHVGVTGSGGGKIPVSAIRVEKANENELSFSKFFYEENKNLMVMKIDSKKVFDNIELKTMQDITPVIIDNMTFVPLRFVAESFGLSVQWNEEDKSIQLTGNGYDVGFRLGESAYSVNGTQKELETALPVQNGRTMLPLRTIAEALGKKVYWDEQYKMILIGDELAVSVSNRNSYKSYLDLLNEHFLVQ